MFMLLLMNILLFLMVRMVRQFFVNFLMRKKMDWCKFGRGSLWWIFWLTKSILKLLRIRWSISFVLHGVLVDMQCIRFLWVWIFLGHHWMRQWFHFIKSFHNLRKRINSRKYNVLCWLMVKDVLSNIIVKCNVTGNLNLLWARHTLEQTASWEIVRLVILIIWVTIGMIWPIFSLKILKITL